MIHVYITGYNKATACEHDEQSTSGHLAGTPHLAVDLRYERQRRRLLFGGLSQLRRTHEERLRVIGCHVNEHL